MINLFGKQHPADGDGDDQTRRLRRLEWKVNLLLVAVSTQLLLHLLSLAKATFLPSAWTLIIAALLTAAVLWIFRRPLLAMLKRVVTHYWLRDNTADDSDSAGGAADRFR